MKLTEAQRRVLGGVSQGHISWSRIMMSYWNHTSQTYVRRSTVNGLLRRGLIEHSADGFVVLTDSGRAALQEARG